MPRYRITLSTDVNLRTTTGFAERPIETMLQDALDVSSILDDCSAVVSAEWTGQSEEDPNDEAIDEWDVHIVVEGFTAPFPAGSGDGVYSGAYKQAIADLREALRLAASELPSDVRSFRRSSAGIQDLGQQVG